MSTAKAHSSSSSKLYQAVFGKLVARHSDNDLVDHRVGGQLCQVAKIAVPIRSRRVISGTRSLEDADYSYVVIIVTLQTFCAILCCRPVPNHGNLRNQMAVGLQRSHNPPCEQPGSHQSEPTVYCPKQYPTSREFISQFTQIDNGNQQQYDGSPAPAQALQMLTMVAQSSKRTFARDLHDQAENHAAHQNMCRIRRPNAE